jgi:hypothetical protein
MVSAVIEPEVTDTEKTKNNLVSLKNDIAEYKLQKKDQ